ncbi:MAG: oligoendopeptidase F [Betaproteobacteria bacterium]
MNKSSSLHTLAISISLMVAHAAMTAQAAGNPKPTTMNRADIPAQYRWDFSPIYADWNAFEGGMKDFDGKIDAFAKMKGTLKNGPAAVLKAYKAFDEIGQLQYKLYGYTHLQRDVDTRNQDISGKFQRVTASFAKLGTATAWFTPELLTVPQATMEKWIAQTPALVPYKFSIMENYRQQKHVLDEKGEKLLSYAARFGATPTATFQELSTSDIKFPKVTLSDGKEVTLTPGAYQAVLGTNRNQADRGKAFEAYLKTYGATSNTYAAIYNGVMQRGWFTAQARNFPTTLDSALDGNAIPPSVVTTLVDAVRHGTAPLQRYLKLRKKILGLDTYHLYDGTIALYKSDTVYTFEDSRDLVLASVAPLGEDYVSRYKKFMSGKQVDVYENEGKRSGAYVSGIYGAGPYMLLNHNDTQDALFTLAHEGGHAMHTNLAFATQPFVTADYTIFVAEVASTTNERFLLNKLLETTTDPKERFLLLQHAVDSIVQTFYTQVLFADFELQAHKLVEQGQPVTAEVLNNIYLKLIKDYYGDAITVDDLYKYTWARIPHFYNSPYYVFQYATCFASSAKLVKDMTTGDAASRKAATDRYLTLLKSGGNDQPMKQLQKAGVDLSKRETVQAVVDQMGELVAQMETEAAKIK